MSEDLIVDNRGQTALFQTGQPFDAQFLGPIESGDSFGVGGMLPAVKLPLLGLLLLLGLTGGATGTVTPITPFPICPMIPTTPCPPQQAACYAAGGTLAEFTNPGEQFAVTTFAGVGTYYIGYSEFRNGAAGPPLGGISDQAAPQVFNWLGNGGKTECGTLVNGAAGLQDCTMQVLTGGICEARIGPTAVRCVCP